MKHILLFGATGRTGKQVLTYALENVSGRRVRYDLKLRRAFWFWS